MNPAVARRVRAFVALGANIGEPVRHLRAAVEDMAALPGTAVVARSSLYRSAPVGLLDQPDFINAVVEIVTALSAQELLESLLAIESALGRERSIPNGPRTIDLDLILYGDHTIQEKELIVPHPRMHERAFVLVPLTEIAPDVIIPGQGPAKALLPAVTDQTLKRLPL